MNKILILLFFLLHIAFSQSQFSNPYYDTPDSPKVSQKEEKKGLQGIVLGFVVGIIVFVISKNTAKSIGLGFLESFLSIGFNPSAGIVIGLILIVLAIRSETKPPKKE